MCPLTIVIALCLTLNCLDKYLMRCLLALPSVAGAVSRIFNDSPTVPTILSSLVPGWILHSKNNFSPSHRWCILDAYYYLCELPGNSKSCNQGILNKLYADKNKNWRKIQTAHCWDNFPNRRHHRFRQREDQLHLVEGVDSNQSRGFAATTAAPEPTIGARIHPLARRDQSCADDAVEVRRRIEERGEEL